MSDVVVVGSFVQDLAFRTKKFPNPGETRIGSFKMGPGGKGFNQAIACSRLGINTTYIGARGNDAFASDVDTFLKTEKLNTRFQTLLERTTGAASIVVNESGQNLIVVALGANDYLTGEIIQAQSSIFSNCKIVVGQLESNLDATRTAFELGKKNGAKIILNPAPINEKVTKELTALADILVPNETEAAFLLHHLHEIENTGAVTNCSDDELYTIARKLSQATVIITLGTAGAFVAPQQGKPFRVSAIKVNAIDTAGAGDAFTGALAAGILRFPDSLENAVRYATVAAGLSTEHEGTAPAMADKDSVQARFNQIWNNS